ncbi:MAG: 4Fe-4S single cluster domain-containing protein [Candidatus Competibacter sp.]|nr:4Fe-4S single cluster domain-containing protein [Candidatus Competibacter sp.]
MKLTVYAIAHPVTALGPGTRVALWVAGCPLHCPGCLTPHLWDAGAGAAVAVAQVAQAILAIPYPLDGLTLTGGEPFAQAEPLAELLEHLKAARPAWNVLCYSGYSLAGLRRWGAGSARLLAGIDVLVAGPYRERRPQTHPLAGSNNQRIHLLSVRGRALAPALDRVPPDALNLALGSDGQQWLIGVARGAARTAIHQALTQPAPGEEPPCVN